MLETGWEFSRGEGGRRVQARLGAFEWTGLTFSEALCSCRSADSLVRGSFAAVRRVKGEGLFPIFNALPLQPAGGFRLAADKAVRAPLRAPSCLNWQLALIFFDADRF